MKKKKENKSRQNTMTELCLIIFKYENKMDMG